MLGVHANIFDLAKCKLNFTMMSPLVVYFISMYTFLYCRVI